MWSEEFQDARHGGHLGYWNKMILAILNLNNTPMPPIKFKLNQTYRSGDFVCVEVLRPSQPNGIMSSGQFT